MEKIEFIDVQYGTPQMPDNVKEEFFWYFNDGETFNGEIVTYEIGASLENGQYINGHILDEWLIKNYNLKTGDEIQLKHWW